MFKWSRSVATASNSEPSPAPPSLAKAAPPPSIASWRSHVAEATIELDDEGRVTGFAPGRQDALAPLADDEGLYLVDRLRAGDRVVLLHAIARLRGGEERVEASVTMRLDEAGREWADVDLALIRLDGATIVLAALRVPDLSTCEPTDGDGAKADRTDEFAELAHELRTPLNAVIGFGQALEAGLFGTLGERQRDAVVSIVEASEHLVEVANTVLDAARLGGADAALQPSDAPLADAVSRSCAMVVNLAQRRGVTIANRVTDHAGPARYDAAALRQITVNLLSNAIKASETGGVVGIDARRTLVDGIAGMEIAVKDAGRGMDDDELAQLGRRFGRGHACDGETTGGLGLPLVKRLVDGHGGTLRFASRPGHGTTASVFLPDALAAEDKVVGIATARRMNETGGALRCAG